MVPSKHINEGQGWSVPADCVVRSTAQCPIREESMLLQEGTADSLQLIRGTDEEQKADFIAKQMGCAVFFVSARAHSDCVHENLADVRPTI